VSDRIAPLVRIGCEELFVDAFLSRLSILASTARMVFIE
jgi:hypothetical protein